jgi:hypothetical protein
MSIKHKKYIVLIVSSILFAVFWNLLCYYASDSNNKMWNNPSSVGYYIRILVPIIFIAVTGRKILNKKT